MTPIGVLHLINEFDDSSISRIVEHLVQHLGRQHYRWHIGGLRGRGNVWEEFSRLGIHVVDFADGQNRSARLTRRIREYILAHQIGIAHSHSPRAVMVAAMALAGTRQTMHLATEHLLNTLGDRRWGLPHFLMDRFSLYLPDHVVAVSQKMRRQIVALPGLSANRVTAIRNAVDCEAFFAPEERDPCRRQFGLTPESQVIGFAGRIEKQKRLDLLLEGYSLILARHPHARLMIIGEGPLRPTLEALASSLGISHAVTWTGFRKDIPRVLAAMDLYVQPSSNEGLSLSILEAMAAGKPVIATDVGGASEVVTDGRTGILIPAGSSSAIGAAIADLLDHPEKRSTLAQAARSHVIQEFGVQRMTDAYRHLYETLGLQR